MLLREDQLKIDRLDRLRAQVSSAVACTGECDQCSSHGPEYQSSVLVKGMTLYHAALKYEHMPTKGPSPQHMELHSVPFGRLYVFSAAC